MCREQGSGERLRAGRGRVLAALEAVLGREFEWWLGALTSIRGVKQGYRGE